MSQSDASLMIDGVLAGYIFKQERSHPATDKCPNLDVTLAKLLVQATHAVDPEKIDGLAELVGLGGAAAGPPPKECPTAGKQALSGGEPHPHYWIVLTSMTSYSVRNHH